MRKPSTQSMCERQVCTPSPARVPVATRGVRGRMRTSSHLKEGTRAVDVQALLHRLSSLTRNFFHVLELTGIGQALVLPQPSALGNLRAGLSFNVGVASSVGPEVPFLKRKVHTVAKLTKHGFLFVLYLGGFQF